MALLVFDEVEAEFKPAIVKSDMMAITAIATNNSINEKADLFRDMTRKPHDSFRK